MKKTKAEARLTYYRQNTLRLLLEPEQVIREIKEMKLNGRLYDGSIWAEIRDFIYEEAAKALVQQVLKAVTGPRPKPSASQPPPHSAP